MANREDAHTGKRETRKPVAIIGAGPVGLAAAVHLLERGLQPVVLEAGPRVGHGIREWGHVRMFSPWKYTVDRAAERALLSAGWTPPDETQLPTGLELVEQYLEPLAALPELRSALRFSSKVVAVTRRAVDKVKSPGRDAMPFLVRYVDADGAEQELEASAVIDASGTWSQPNPMGANGIPARGERSLARRIHYGIPDVTGRDRARFAGRRTLVVGTGHSAINNLLGLAALIDDDAGTRVLWGMRRSAPGNAYGGGSDDGLPARGELGASLRRKVDEGSVRLLTGLRIGALSERDGEIVVTGVEGDEVARVDEIIVSTGARPDLQMLRELRLDLDPAIESPRTLGPLIDPNEHSCGSVRPHGAFELEQPEPGFFIVGMKSYGRAPTFLLATGYEQARSVASYLAGDFAAAREVMLELPETGVCNVSFGKAIASGDACCGPANTNKEKTMEKSTEKSTEKSGNDTTNAPAPASACCGGPAKEDPSACCVQDAEAKANGEGGCGCSVAAPSLPEPAPSLSSCCG
jgi:hypothetical protein